jgi:hypothetical protein
MLCACEGLLEQLNAWRFALPVASITTKEAPSNPVLICWGTSQCILFSTRSAKARFELHAHYSAIISSSRMIPLAAASYKGK